LFLEKTCLQDNIQKQVKKTQNKGKSAKQNTYVKNAQKREMEKPTFMQTHGPSTDAGEAQA
jgi:hypothetical protein